MMSYILTKIGTRLAIYLLRPYAIIPLYLRGLFGHILRWMGKSSSHDGPAAEMDLARTCLVEPPCYDWVLPDLFICVTLCTMYGVVAPAVIFASLPFFYLYSAVVRYDLFFVYVQEWDSGGLMFFPLANFTVFSLLLSLIMLQAYLTVKGQNHSSGYIHNIAIPVLMGLVILLWHLLNKRYKQACKDLSVYAAKQLDISRKPSVDEPFSA